MDKELPVSVWPEWKITEKIGEGSFGKVYKAERIERDKIFYSAIKVISIPGSSSELKSVQSESGSVNETREYFRNLMEECIQEVSTMEYFRGNSHVVAVEDYKVVEYLDTIGWDIFIRMEYLTSFLEYCSGNQLKEDEVIRLGIDLCKALEYCQMLNIIHRDIKPENIFISRFGEFKLGDFGIARELERSMGGFSRKGTYSYMAPEMYRGETYDARVDIYSLGIVMYKLLNKNRLPFLSLEKQLITYRDKEVAMNRRMSGEELPPPLEASPELGEIILRACAFDRRDRYPVAEDFRTALEDLRYSRRSARMAKKVPEEPEEEEEVQEEPEEKKPLVKKPDPRNVPLLIAIGVMSVAVVIVSVIFLKMLLGSGRDSPKDGGNQILVMDEAEDPELANYLADVREWVTVIEDSLEHYNWIGSEEEGRISYLDQDGNLVKILITPKLSPDGVYEEYYYWNGSLFCVFVWDEDQEDVNYYYYRNEELQRWIDSKNVCHDFDRENPEFVDREEKYLEHSRNLTMSSGAQ